MLNPQEYFYYPLLLRLSLAQLNELREDALDRGQLIAFDLLTCAITEKTHAQSSDIFPCTVTNLIQ